jgi:hypothetical protein
MNMSTSTRSLFCAAGLILTTLLSACGGGGDKGRDPILGVAGTSLVSVVVTPATASIAMGANQQYVATANFADGSARVVTTESGWTSGTPAVASIIAASGLASGVSGGNSTISARYGSKTGTAALTVRPNLMAIVVTPANPTILMGTTQQFAASGNYSDGTSVPITTPLTWGSSNTLVATINSSGLASGVIGGSTIVTASNGTLIGNAVLNVVAPLPPPPVVPGVPVPPPVIPPFVPPVLPVPVDTVPLGLATNFAVLAGTALTNNSNVTTIIGGDVGSPSQTVPPTLKAGFVNYVAGPELINGLNALTDAITNANGRACTVSSASGVDLGGLILPPGVYCYDGAISITGTLILNGPGVYIFRTKMTLNATAGAIVATVNADPSQVFWVPVGATTLGANGHFKGSILGQASAITVGDNTDLFTGRVLSHAAVTLASNKIDK